MRFSKVTRNLIAMGISASVAMSGAIAPLGVALADEQTSLDEAETKLAEVNQELEVQNEQNNRLQIKKAELEKKEEETSERYATLARADYKFNLSNFIDVLVNSKTLDEFVTQIQTLNRLAQDTNAAKAEYESVVKELAQNEQKSQETEEKANELQEQRSDIIESMSDEDQATYTANLQSTRDANLAAQSEAAEAAAANDGQYVNSDGEAITVTTSPDSNGSAASSSNSSEDTSSESTPSEDTSSDATYESTSDDSSSQQQEYTSDEDSSEESSENGGEYVYSNDYSEDTYYYDSGEETNSSDDGGDYYEEENTWSDSGTDYSENYSSGLDTGSSNSIVETAYAMIGVPYVWGGEDPSGFDCSGLAMYCYAAAGYSIPHGSSAQASMCNLTYDVNSLSPGDLVFYSTNGSVSGVYHVGVYVGGGMAIGANTDSVELYSATSISGYIGGGSPV